MRFIIALFFICLNGFAFPTVGERIKNLRLRTQADEWVLYTDLTEITSLTRDVVIGAQSVDTDSLTEIFVSHLTSQNPKVRFAAANQLRLLEASDETLTHVRPLLNDSVLYVAAEAAQVFSNAYVERLTRLTIIPWALSADELDLRARSAAALLVQLNRSGHHIQLVRAVNRVESMLHYKVDDFYPREIALRFLIAARDNLTLDLTSKILFSVQKAELLQQEQVQDAFRKRTMTPKLHTRVQRVMEAFARFHVHYECDGPLTHGLVIDF